MANSSMTLDDLGHQIDSFKTVSGKTITFHCIKHGSIRIDFDGLEFHIDPVAKLDANVTDYSKFPKADYIIVTHEHFDHLDLNAISDLKKDGTVIITNKASSAKLANASIMSNGDSKTLRDDIQLEAVPAYNITPDHTQFHPKGRDNGFILTLDGLRVYIAGDTEDIEEMAKLHDIDVAFMPCNQPYTMTPTQLAHAVDMVKPKVLFPYHYSNTDMSEVTTVLKDSNADVRIRNYQ